MSKSYKKKKKKNSAVSQSRKESTIQAITENDETENYTVASPPAKSRILILEPAVLLLFLAWSLANTVFQSQIVYQTCTVIFEFNETVCRLLGTNNGTNETGEIEEIVQPYAVKILMARTMIESLIPALVSLFIGPWSDKFGRKPVIVTTFVGYFFIYASITVITHLSTTMAVNPWYYLLPFIPISICGGNCAMITGVLCYITDVTTPGDRAIRMAYLEASIYVGVLLGSTSSSFILAATSATALFGIAAVASLLGVLYVTCFVKETIRQEVSVDKCTKFRALFDFTLVSDMFNTCFRRRESINRTIIWITILTLVLSIFVLDANISVFYLFLREKFSWTIRQTTFYDAANVCTTVLGNILGMYLLNKVLGISEITLAIISYCSSFGDYSIKAIASEPWHLYVGIAVASLRGISGPMCRALLSHLVPAHEIGKIYSLTTSLESISPLGSAPLYSFVYANTLNTFPGAFNLISAGVFSLCVLLMIVVSVCMKRNPEVMYEPVADE